MRDKQTNAVDVLLAAWLLTLASTAAAQNSSLTVLTPSPTRTTGQGSTTAHRQTGSPKEPAASGSAVASQTVPNATKAASSNAHLPLPATSYKQQKQQQQQPAQQQPPPAARNVTAAEGRVQAQADAAVLRTNHTSSTVEAAVPALNTTALPTQAQQRNTTAAAAAAGAGRPTKQPASKAAEPTTSATTRVTANTSKAATPRTSLSATAAEAAKPVAGPVMIYKAVKGAKEQAQILQETAPSFKAGQRSPVKSWRSSDDMCSKWWGVKCYNSRASEISLQNAGLRGSVPKKWAALAPSLSSIVLTDNELTGTIPREWSTLKQLYSVGLDGNQLTGPIPAEWSAITRLTTVQFSKNHLQGNLPASWGKLHSLGELYLNDNQLTGTLPKQWSKMGSLYIMRLDGNNLTGSIPSQWADMYSLRFLSLRDNPGLTGCLPYAWKDKVKFQSKADSFEYTIDITAEGVLSKTQITGWCKDDGLQHLAPVVEKPGDDGMIASGD